MDWALLKAIARKVYKCEDWRDYKRYYVFLTRCKLHERAMEQHLEFFMANPTRKKAIEGCPWLIDQATRQVFYKDSTFGERSRYVQKHVLYMEKLFKPQLMERIYEKGERVLLWQDTFEDKPLCLYLVFRDGQQKEGCLSLELVYDSLDLQNTGWEHGTHVYQIMFTLGDGKINSTEPVTDVDLGDLCITIGALQGLAGGSDFIKRLTKAYFGYRPKNLIMWCLRCVADALATKEIVAISNAGYYAMNHLRLDRKLKVDLDAFWTECEGVATEDKRFYLLPVAEQRKAMSDLKPSKRAQHRRRFEKLDAIKAEIEKNLQEWRK